MPKRSGSICQSQNIQAVIDGNKDHIAVVRQIEPIKGDLFKGIAAKKSASVNPDKNGLLFSVQRFRRPDIQILVYGR